MPVYPGALIIEIFRQLSTLTQRSVVPNDSLKQIGAEIVSSDMRIRLALLLGLIFVASGMARTADLALTGAKIYTSPTDPPIKNGSIVMRDGRILSVGPGPTVKIPRSARVIDCEGLVVTAGFWNSHVHTLAPALL